jgi:hypothetical protein
MVAEGPDPVVVPKKHPNYSYHIILYFVTSRNEMNGLLLRIDFSGTLPEEMQVGNESFSPRSF